MADVATDANAETTETNKERSDAWTCVSNCNRSEIEQKVKNALLPVGFMINRSQIDLLIKHKRLNHSHIFQHSWPILETSLIGKANIPPDYRRFVFHRNSNGLGKFR